MFSHPTYLDAFIARAQDADTRDRHVVECGDEAWTYEDLDAISSGLALELAARYGSRPTVAIIAENLPYTFAVQLATWKLGGIVAPLDSHTPQALLEPMLKKISPSCVFIPSTEKILHETTWPVLRFQPEDTTIAALCQRYMDGANLPADKYPLPSATDISFYLFTSSASDVSNIKCVPLSHGTVMVQGASLVTWHINHHPQVSFEHTRVLGWAVLSHMISILHDIAHTYLTGGCYIFALVPSGYHGKTQSGDVPNSILRAIEAYSPDLFAGVPWIFENIIKVIDSEPDMVRREHLCSLLASLKAMMLGGAPTSLECIRWALDRRVPLGLSIGMTELGGTLFHRLADLSEDGWPMSTEFLPDLKLTLVDDDGNPHEEEGELYVSSKYIASGYLDHDSSAFTVASDGVITFRTGDRYARKNDHFKWLGRKDDFIMLVSSEMIDPRVLEKSLDSSPSISRSCVIGNHFLRGPAEFLCVLVELSSSATPGAATTSADISRAVRAINKELPPPLRINWSRVLILEPGQTIPITRKGLLFRKNLEALFGQRVLSLSVTPTSIESSPPPVLKTNGPAVKRIVSDLVATALSLSRENLEGNVELSFAELGMDSAAAVDIVSKLNQRFDLDLPRNACHTNVDLNALSDAVLSRLTSREILHPTPLRAPITPPSDDIVIVGQAVRLPGELNTAESFWQALMNKRQDLLTPVPRDRWDHASFYRAPGESSRGPCDITFERAGFLDVAHFDNTFFGISSAEADQISPPIRLILETAFEALENANIPTSSLKGTPTGVFVGDGDWGYSQLLFAALGLEAYTRFHGTGVSTSAACGRLSYLLDISGPSITVDTACSSGMVAFDQAVQYLKSGQAETAIVCAANVHSWPGNWGFLSAQKMVSPNSRCASFSSDADGYVPAEGAVSLIVKTRAAAMRDGDKILAVVKSTATRHNGKSLGMVAPSAGGQAALQRAVLSAAGLNPGDIDFIETHGTGTSLGDLIEIEGINSVFQGSHIAERPLFVGAAKACVGHTEVTAGLTGIVKALMQLSTGQVPGLGSVAGGKLNPELNTTLVPLQISENTGQLLKGDAPHRGLVVSYGFAGSLAATILEAPPSASKDIAVVQVSSPWMIFVVSAKTRDALHANISQYLDFCTAAPEADFRAICYTSCVGREMYRHRFACVVKDLHDLVQRLQARIVRAAHASDSISRATIVFAFPGQGSQFYGMAKAMSERFTGFRETLAAAAEVAKPLVDFDIVSLLLGRGAPTPQIDESAVAQICIFVYQFSVCQFLRSIDISPDAVLGNSLGEISAAVQAGVLSYELGLQFVIARAKILAPRAGDIPAGMAAIGAHEADIAQAVDLLKLTGRVATSVFSGPADNVCSGDLEAIEALVSHVKQRGIRAKILNVDQGFHSHCIEGRMPELQTWIDDHFQKLGSLELPMFSTTLGSKMAPGQPCQPHHWVDHARNPAHFQQAVADMQKSYDRAYILDVGPTPTALAALGTNPPKPNHVLLSSCANKDKDQVFAFLTALGSLIENGAHPQLLRLFGAHMPKINLPTYPFQRQRHWPDFVPSRSHPTIFAPSTGVSSKFVVNEPLLKVLDDHRIQGEIVLPGAAMVNVFARANHPIDIHFHRPLVLHGAGDYRMESTTEGGSFSMSDEAGKLCSGTSLVPTARTPDLIVPNGLPETVVTGVDAVYLSFTNIQFGPSFQNIASLKMWEDVAEGAIKITRTSNTDHDNIRALDAAIHQFGTIKFGADLGHGAFLPMSLEGYTVYSDDPFPSSFLCRYRLPITVERNGRVAFTSFQVISLAGQILASCDKYSVAWVDMGVPESPFTFQHVWIPKELPPSVSVVSEVAIFKYYEASSTEALDTLSHAPNAAIVLDVTGAEDAPESATFSDSWQNILQLLKTLGRHKGSFTFVVVSTALEANSQPPSVLGAMAQGMLRVFRREVGLQNAYGIEVPGDLAPSSVFDILQKELAAPRGAVKDTMVSYRHSSAGLQRFVPELRSLLLGDIDTRTSGVAVIVGMGSIGSALASHLIIAGASHVVFIGRRAITDDNVSRLLEVLDDKRCSYLQADASDISSLRHILQQIGTTYGDIRSIIHTAATVKDAPIASITVGAFDQVLRSKLHVAYNLHLLTEELGLQLETFVLLSSVSVPLGNPGQVAYVAANAFLDALAALRRNAGLPGVSLQLGPWESELVNNLVPQTDLQMLRTMPHKEGLPLLMRAARSPSAGPVQLIAVLDTDLLARVPAFASDSLFASLVEGSSETARVLSSAEINESVVSLIRGVLELPESASLELGESLTALGVDSIAFGQIRGAVLREHGVEVPLVYLSDAFSMHDMIDNVVQLATS
ncbi:hypothetical protein FB45DRAFT_824078 [Roridomyces roridus]|uniref:Polyketide synthase n=1 Tax=Roridomyces roridus TaxID=1738132 RepID=A0AAD7CAW8_9AGAR|nr:hypothetical protein FB45DRAFT_824078 [Roridomyces roridus]